MLFRTYLTYWDTCKPEDQISNRSLSVKAQKKVFQNGTFHKMFFGVFFFILDFQFSQMIYGKVDIEESRIT